LAKWRQFTTKKNKKHWFRYVDNHSYSTNTKKKDACVGPWEGAPQTFTPHGCRI
jgi:hypothetical protein